MKNMGSHCFLPLEETISFYTRNDFAIMNHFLVKNYDDMWKYALIAYHDNQAILDEYSRGERTIDSDYDEKWINSLRKRVIEDLTDTSKQMIIKNAQNDIANILSAMSPAQRDTMLFRTAWIDQTACSDQKYAYSREYRSLDLETGSIIDIHTISSFSRTPYREEDDVGSDFYRYEIDVKKGMPILELDQFVTHNEEGEILLPPMRCEVVEVLDSKKPRCKGIIRLKYMERIEVMPLCKSRILSRFHKA